MCGDRQLHQCDITNCRTQLDACQEQRMFQNFVSVNTPIDGDRKQSKDSSKQVMSAYWLLVAFAAVRVFKVYCETGPAGQDAKSGDGILEMASLFGFKPCIDETCEDYHIYGPSDPEPKDPSSQSEVELPRAHCMLLRPSAVNLFGEIETMYPGITDIKYRMLEELIEYMRQFSSLKLQSCKPNMQLIDLVILAANSLKTQYALKGDEECIYETYQEDKIGKPVPSDEVNKMPCDPESSGYITGTSCSGSTMKPELETPVMPQTTEKPYVSSSTTKPIAETTKMPCSDGVTTEKPCQPSDAVTEEYSSAEEIEIIAEDEESESMIPQVGSLRGIPGVHYPNYTDIPITSFTCADKKYMPGFYADLDTGCQVFHVCYEHRRESFLCPVGTIFNQPILACDYWYSSNCSLASHYYDVNERTELKEEKIDAEVEELLTLIEETEKPRDELSVEGDLDKIAEFFPVKAIVTEIKPEIVVPIEPTTSYTEEVASEIVDKMATTATKVISGTRQVIKAIPEPVVLKPVFKPELDFFPSFKKPMKMADLLKQAVVPLVKAKLAAIPISKATALKTAVPIAGLAKAKVAVPVVKAAAVPMLAKAKVAAAVPAAKVAIAAPVIAKVAAFPAVKAAAAVPVLAKAKAAAALPIAKAKVAVAAPVIAKAKMAVPAAKVAAAAPFIAKGKIAVPAFKVAAAKVAKSSIPALKAKMVASAVPLAKTKIVPLMKAKVVKSAGMPFLKAKMLALPLAKSKLAGPLPLAKVKLAKAVAISPLTKKALALGYMKLLKAKKVALMG